MKNVLNPTPFDLEITTAAIPVLSSAIKRDTAVAEQDEAEGNHYGAGYFWTRVEMAERALQIMEDSVAGKEIEEWEFDFAHAVKCGDYDYAQAIENEN